MLGVVLAVVLALAFAFTTGVQDAANSIATLIATRAGRPGPALVMATAAILVGPFLVGSAVADTVAGIVDVEPVDTVEVVTAALAAALVWNAAAWYAGIPSSATHALVGGLVGAAIPPPGLDAVNWGGLDGLRPVGVVGIARRARDVADRRRGHGARRPAGLPQAAPARHAPVLGARPRRAVGHLRAALGRAGRERRAEGGRRRRRGPSRRRRDLVARLAPCG